MRLSPIRTLSIFIFIIALVGCANRGTPSGGEIDIEPPFIEKSTPENFSTNFQGEEIIIIFNEYIKIKDIRKQLIISPPMDTAPVIYPAGGASKYVSIRIKDTLEANTTYAFNFGQSIVDNNEENPFSYFRYVFSTGTTIDSLSVKGIVVDALKQNPDTFVSVMLYEVDSTYSDSIVYKDKPRYITNTLDSLTTFSIDNIKAGTYKLLALKDKNSNYLFNQKNDKIAFNEGFITVPKDTTYSLKMFSEDVNFKAIKPKQESETKIIFPYEGDYKDMRIKILGDTPEDYNFRITKVQDKDTLNYWYRPNLEADSTLFVVTNKAYSDTLKHRYRKIKPDSLVLSKVVSGSINFDEDFTLEANIPLKKIDTSKIKLTDSDTLRIPYKVEYDSISNRYKFPVKKEESQQYTFKIFPGAFTDFYDTENKDTLNFGFRTKRKSEYGNVRVNIRNAKFPMLVQLINKNGGVDYERYATESPIVDFTDVVPKLYRLRVVFDANANGKYDTGNYLLGLQPERVSYAKEMDEVRSNFDQIVEFILLD
ncbi:Ig-like domain-containing protein [Winogradskyella sp. UBA3174]|uniref:Ig-like domain-containing protein n=1 Tax=Winogradskyella sp. UBA3174 TaxID=1947785 RepID=UPI0025EACE3E|nr:Ig-like domain-containing protein [Winogradskyella sp. UBA3174]|tara:strand:+ start:29807 stop:31417 length:1611 start_codon:yes stop_codon:yes gene_type:complete